jgi:hypothetical protein
MGMCRGLIIVAPGRAWRRLGGRAPVGAERDDTNGRRMEERHAFSSPAGSVCLVTLVAGRDLLEAEERLVRVAQRRDSGFENGVDHTIAEVWSILQLSQSVVRSRGADVVRRKPFRKTRPSRLQ